MASPSVVLTAQCQLDPDDVAGAFADAGATRIRVERGVGDPGAGIASYFVILFEDPHGAARVRGAKGFVAMRSPEHPDGWTHVGLGSDVRGAHFIDAAAAAFGGEAFDELTKDRREYAPAPSPTP